jgi:5'-nucleotidase
LTESAERAVAPRIARVIATAGAPITRTLTAAGESALGDLVADAQRDAMHADVALMNPGGLRSDLRPGPITWGDILTLHPFGNRLLKLRLTGAQLLQVLEQQWPADPNAIPRILKTSGFFYVWDPHRPSGRHIVIACDAHHQQLEPLKSYSVTVNDFLAAGGDGFVALKDGQLENVGPLDAEALSLYLSRHVGAVEEHTEGRIALGSGAAGSVCAAG